MADYSDFIIANLNKGLLNADRTGLKPSLTTDLYSGTGVPTNWNQLKPSLRHADGTLRAGLIDSEGGLKFSSAAAGGGGGGDPDGEVLTMSHTTGSAFSHTPGDYVMTDGTDFTSGSAAGTGLVLTLTVDGAGVLSFVITNGGAGYLDTENPVISIANMEAQTGGTWFVAPTFDILTVSGAAPPAEAGTVTDIGFTAGSAFGAAAGTVPLADGVHFVSGSASGIQLALMVTTSDTAVTGVSILTGGTGYLDSETLTMTTTEAGLAFGGFWSVAPTFPIITVI